MTPSHQKTALVTGANSGIGLALAKKLLAEQYQVVGTSRSGRLEGIDHPHFSVLQLDVTDPASVAAAVALLGRQAAGIDLLVNNAGVSLDYAATAPTPEILAQTFATNVTGTVLFTEPVLPLLNDGARVVFISSKMGLLSQAAPNGPAYRMSKAAINMYAAMLAQRLAGQDIKVVAMHPGWVQTRLGGSSAPFTTEQSAERIFNGIVHNTESGGFWNVEVDGLVASE